MFIHEKYIRLVQGFITFCSHPQKAYQFIQKCKKRGFKESISNYLKNNLVFYENEFLPELRSFSILTPPHSLPLALLFKNSLAKASFECEVFLDDNEFISASQESIPVVFAPQVFKKLPKKFIAFQLEQRTSNWFTPSYFELLKNASFVFEFSENNLVFLQEHGVLFSKLFYLPITPTDLSIPIENPHSSIQFDIVFYGCLNERRRKILSELSKQFSVLIIEDSFGQSLYTELSRAKIIVNIHYYEGAQLETTRLVEAISLGFNVVSERTGNREDDFFKDKIVFAEQNDINDLISKIKQSLSSWKISDKKTETKETSFFWFDFFLYRFLLSQDMLSFEDFCRFFLPSYPISNFKICLSLPESCERRAAFLSQKESNLFTIFPGLRHNLGWLGCGMSYKFLFSLCQKKGIELVCICEDDVIFTANFLSRLKTIENFLLSSPNWEVYCGLISDLSRRVEVKKQFIYEGEQFVLIDKAVGLVFTFYSKKSLAILSAWDPFQKDVKSNTIDRFMESHLNFFLTSLPFLVSHDANLTSTLWGKEAGKEYEKLISESEKKLIKLSHNP